MCRELKCLPSSGSLLDQDSFYMYGMDLVVAATNAKEKFDMEKRQAAAKNQR